MINFIIRMSYIVQAFVTQDMELFQRSCSSMPGLAAYHIPFELDVGIGSRSYIFGSLDDAR